MTNQKSKIIILIIGLLLFPVIAFAATLYLEPSQGEYQPEDTFIVKIKIDIEEECINTVKVDLKFSQEILEAVDFSQGDSILTLWLETPQINQSEGLISFVGGVPAGYCGEIPGGVGESNLLGRIIFKVQESGIKQAEVKFLHTSQVLLNDGLGTLAELSTKGVAYTISQERLGPAKDEWQQELEEDKIPPEPFEIEIHQDSAIFEGKYFIIFSTTDKQTGLSHFEFKEGERDWEKAESPYLLEDQSLKSIIKVKAVDKAGNERIAEYIPEIPKKPFPWWIIPVVLFGVLVVIWIWKKYIKKH
ncbi:hypothetical protein KJA13_02480 [Patescibacteria group bacterium]|nr:hypothetical protein [Patescibacteria group bacterium]